ncbi:putative zinc-binding alcohol dehydrogenase [Nocardia sp. RB56]|uniref:Putative zinc-binding alcohol dehydrogenase n=2 Tax=Nocardia aurantia TaxID=2585199 RepID=A0A7K0DLX2_9NOCA|nr:zinc-dependent alcohol dehydrogenase family protein [Nocardia aurantia]MQY26647.1 putative zinc-binding alcohol dehydrogenase [Nocardia aurantia]
MRATMIHAPGDIRFEQRPDPRITEPADAIVRTVATCVCGSDLWSYRGINPVGDPHPMGHEYVGVVEEAGRDVDTVRPGQLVIGSFIASDNTCPHCRYGFQTACMRREAMTTCQAEYIRIPQAGGTLVAVPGDPDPALLPSLLTLSDVMGTGWYAAVAAQVKPGGTVAVVGDGAVGLCGVLAAKELGADRIIAMSRHHDRQKLALDFGATDLVTERGDEGVARIMDLTHGVGADSVLECVGTAESSAQARRATRPGGSVGFVGLPHGVEIDGGDLFGSMVGLRGGPAPVRRFLPDLIDRVLSGRMAPGKVFDLTLPLSEVAEAYRAMDERRAIKVLLQP